MLVFLFVSYRIGGLFLMVPHPSFLDRGSLLRWSLAAAVGDVVAFAWGAWGEELARVAFLIMGFGV